MSSQVKPLDWVDISLHCLFAALWAFAGGYGAGTGWGYASGAPGLVDAVLGWALVATATVGGIGAGWLFWILRERLQHGYGFGGRQSNMEWQIPAGVTVVAFGAGFLIA